MPETKARVMVVVEFHWISDLLHHLYHRRVNMCYSESLGPARPPTPSMLVASSTPLSIVYYSLMDGLVYIVDVVGIVSI